MLFAKLNRGGCACVGPSGADRTGNYAYFSSETHRFVVSSIVAMPFYKDHVYPLLVNTMGDPGPIRKIRQQIIPLAQGTVLEIGVGSGINFAHYDPGRVRKLYALEPNPGMVRLAERRRGELNVEFLDLPGERIPLDDGVVARNVLGSTSLQLLRRCPVAVWVARSAPSPRISVVLAPVALGDMAAPIVHAASSLAASFDARLVVVHAVDPAHPSLPSLVVGIPGRTRTCDPRFRKPSPARSVSRCSARC